MNRQDKILYLAGVLQGTGVLPDMAKAIAVDVLDKLFPPLPPIEMEKSMQRAYIPIPGGYEVQTKGTGSSFRIASVDDDIGRINIPGCRYEYDYLTQMALDIREAYGE